MKNAILILTLFCSGLIAQAETGPEPVYEVKGNLVAVTTFHENGNVKVKGFYKNKKLHGEWNKFNVKGIKITRATYCNGKKVGKWMFLNDGVLTEVNHEEGRVSEVYIWNTESTDSK